ncbi:MAG: hypothetical protein JXQ75_15115 [Phycisphaerae bacterium]|nr:hypothetical protein [Phycisphaerae bacterium]
MPQGTQPPLPFVIQAAGRFDPSQVRLSYDPALRPTTPELEELIAVEWERQAALARQSDQLFFNGGLLRYVRHEVTAEGPLQEGGTGGCGMGVSPVSHPGPCRPEARATGFSGPGAGAIGDCGLEALAAGGPGAGPGMVAGPGMGAKTDIEARPDGPDGREWLHLTVGPTCYRDFVGTNLYNSHRLGEFDWHFFSNPIGTTATLVTADGLICCGRRSSRVAFHAGYVHTFGGGLEEQDRAADGSIDPFVSLCRELTEELAIQRAELADLCCVGLIRDTEIHQPELLFEARLAMTADVLRSRWESAECRDEHDEIVTLPDQPGAIVPFICNCGPIAPVAIGALFLHGRRSSGETWFRSAAEDFRGAARPTPN